VDDQNDVDAMVAEDSSSAWETSDEEVEEFDPNSSTLPSWLKKELTGEGDLDEEETSEPIRSKNEVTDLAPPEPLPEIAESVVVQPAGTVTTIIPAGPRDGGSGAKFLVQAIEGGKVLDEGSIICLPSREPIGRVEEIFGPVTVPFYIVR
jgi:hypothetical protein